MDTPTIGSNGPQSKHASPLKDSRPWYVPPHDPALAMLTQSELLAQVRRQGKLGLANNEDPELRKLAALAAVEVRTESRLRKRARDFSKPEPLGLAEAQWLLRNAQTIVQTAKERGWIRAGTARPAKSHELH